MKFARVETSYKVTNLLKFALKNKVTVYSGSIY